MNQVLSLTYVVIPVHNRKELTRNCLEALSKQDALGPITVVVDDGSSDGTGEMLIRDFPYVVRISGNGNLWWSGSVNAAIKFALERGAERILLLNNDTVPGGSFFSSLGAAVQARPDALIGVLQVDSETGLPVYGGERINWWTGRYDNLLDTLPANELVGFQPVTHLPGRGLIIPAAVFQEIGFFPERALPQRAADYDFSHHAHRAGRQVSICYDVVLPIITNDGNSADEYIRRRSLRNYLRHLFDPRGAAHLRTFVVYATRNCPWYFLPTYLALGLFRRLFSYLARWYLERVHGRVIEEKRPRFN